jgi:D-alanine-D-alanine ligase
MADPLPFVVGEMLFPLELIRTKGLAAGFHHVDANIGKIIVPGKSPGRNYELFQSFVTQSSSMKDNGQIHQSLPDVEKTIQKCVLHMFGSTSSEYYEGVSTYYVKTAVSNLDAPLQESYSHRFLRGHPDGTWSLPSSLDPTEMEQAPRVTLGLALHAVTELKPDLMLPHMYCMQGMTTCRGIFNTLDMPYIGNGAAAMALSTDKWHTRAILDAAGVPVAPGELIRPGQVPKMEPPYVLKPCREDNSQGVCLYRGGDPADLEQKLAHAFQFDDQVIVEAFVPLGHEIRIAMVEDEDGEPTIMLPVCEYVLPSDIRNADNKLVTDSRGVPTTPVQ